MNQNNSMSPFDLSNVTREAVEQATKSSEGGSRSSAWSHPVLYPGPGKLTVKLLFNPKSNSVLRTIKRHKINNVNYACLGQYNEDCPVCKVQRELKDSLNIDVNIGTTTRAIAYAQYISAARTDGQSYKTGMGAQERLLNSGELVTLMVPWTVYNSISTVLANAGDNISRLIASNTGELIDISRDASNQYTAGMAPYQTYQSRPTDEEFYAMMNDLNDLNSEGIPASPTDELRATLADVARELYAKHFRTQAAINPTGLAESAQGVPHPAVDPTQQTNPFSAGQQQSSPSPVQSNPFSQTNPGNAQQSAPYGSAPAQTQQSTPANPFASNQQDNSANPFASNQQDNSANPFATQSSQTNNPASPYPDQQQSAPAAQQAPTNPFEGQANPFANNGSQPSSNLNPFNQV